MTAAACGTCGAAATHRLRTGHLLCDACTGRAITRLDRHRAAHEPQPLTAQPALFEVAS